MTPPMTDTATATVLVVDDEPAIVKVLSTALRARGYRATAAGTGQDALDAIALDPPDVVLLDLGLPDFDGLEVLNQLRLWSAVPVIVLTAEGAEDRKIAALDSGADDYVT